MWEGPDYWGQCHTWAYDPESYKNGDIHVSFWKWEDNVQKSVFYFKNLSVLEIELKMELEKIILNEVTQSWKDKYDKWILFIILFIICGF